MRGRNIGGSIEGEIFLKVFKEDAKAFRDSGSLFENAKVLV
jgi:hypothetical protein